MVCKAEPVEKQQQINLQEKPRGRGRGRGRGSQGRGRKGRGGGKKKGNEENDEDEGLNWTEDMQKEWEKFKAGEDSGRWEWDQVFGLDGCENWSGDWSHPPKAWDRLACLDGKVSEHKLQDVSKEKKRKSPNTKEVETKVAKTGKNHDKKHPVDTGKGLEKPDKTEKKTYTQDKEEEEEEEPLKNTGVPRKLKDQTNEIMMFLGKAHKFKVPNNPEKLDETIKSKLREETPSSDDCRLNVYWKRPAVGVHLKSEKRDIGTYGLDSHNGPFGLRLAAVLKAASMLVPWNKFIWPIGNGNNKTI